MLLHYNQRLILRYQFFLSAFISNNCFLHWLKCSRSKNLRNPNNHYFKKDFHF